MVDERDRARARLGLPPLASTSAAAPAPVVDERTQLAAKGIIPKPESESAPRYYNYYTGQYVSSPDLIKPNMDIGDEDRFLAEDFDIAEDTEEDGKKGGRVVVSTFVDPTTGDTYSIYSDGSRELIAKGSKAADAAAAAAREKLLAEQEAARIAEEKRRAGQSAYSLLFSEFERYGMAALVEPLKKFIEDGISPAEFTLRLRETDAYKKRFAANAQRIGKGLRALSEAEYITMEDQYQNVMRQYGLPETYYTRGEMGRQEGFEKFIAGDVSAVELEDRISTAQKRVLNANPEVTQALKQFYPDITNADILAYTLDPKNAIENIKRKVTAAEIGGAAIQSGLQTGVARAEELAAAGVAKDVAEKGFGTIAGGLQRGSQLASIYGENPYTQTTAEKEVFGLAGKTEAEKQRKKLTGLEKATFSGQTGLTSGALARDRAGAY
jgi:hypothetical protein